MGPTMCKIQSFKTREVQHFWLHAPLSRFHKWMGSASEAVSRFWLLYPWTLSMVSYRGCQHKKWMPIKHGKITFDRFCFISGVCTPHFIRLCGQTGEKISTQTWTWEKQLKYSTLFRFLQKHEEKIRTGVKNCCTVWLHMYQWYLSCFIIYSFWQYFVSCSVGSLGLKDLGSALFGQAVSTLFAVKQAKSNIESESTSLLQVSSCFGNHKASLLLATIHLSGLGHTVNKQQVESVHSLSLSYCFITCNTTCVMMTDNTDFYCVSGSCL